MKDALKTGGYGKIIEIPVVKQTLFYNLEKDTLVEIVLLDKNVAVVRAKGEDKSYFHDKISVIPISKEEYDEDVIEAEIE